MKYTRMKYWMTYWTFFTNQHKEGPMLPAIPNVQNMQQFLQKPQKPFLLPAVGAPIPNVQDNARYLSKINRQKC